MVRYEVQIIAALCGATSELITLADVVAQSSPGSVPALGTMDGVGEYATSFSMKLKLDFETFVDRNRPGSEKRAIVYNILKRWKKRRRPTSRDLPVSEPTALKYLKRLI